MSRMSPDIAARWQRTVEQWQRETPTLPQPLRFEVPSWSSIDIAADSFFGDAYTDHLRFYAENRGGGRYRLILLYWITGVLGCAIGFIELINPGGTIFWIPDWVSAISLIIIALLAKRAEKRVTRKNTIVFERESGKVYIPSYDEAPHQMLDFYDQYFYIVDGRVDVNRFGALYIYLPKGTLEDGREVGGFPIRLAFVGDREDAENAWHFLVRYMDTSLPFDKEEMEYFDFIAAEKKRLGYKVEDIRRVPGERVFF